MWPAGIFWPTCAAASSFFIEMSPAYTFEFETPDLTHYNKSAQNMLLNFTALHGSTQNKFREWGKKLIPTMCIRNLDLSFGLALSLNHFLLMKQLAPNNISTSKVIQSSQIIQIIGSSKKMTGLALINRSQSLSCLTMYIQLMEINLNI